MDGWMRPESVPYHPIESWLLRGIRAGAGMLWSDISFPCGSCVQDNKPLHKNFVMLGSESWFVSHVSRDCMVACQKFDTSVDWHVGMCRAVSSRLQCGHSALSRCFRFTILAPVGSCPTNHLEINMRRLWEVSLRAFAKACHAIVCRVDSGSSHCSSRYLVKTLWHNVSYKVSFVFPQTRMLLI